MLIGEVVLSGHARVHTVSFVSSFLASRHESEPGLPRIAGCAKKKKNVLAVPLTDFAVQQGAILSHEWGVVQKTYRQTRDS